MYPCRFTNTSHQQFCAYLITFCRGLRARCVFFPIWEGVFRSVYVVIPLFVFCYSVSHCDTMMDCVLRWNRKEQDRTNKEGMGGTGTNII